MLSWLKTHPFAVEAFFERSLVLTFAAPAAEVQALLPAPLLADTFGEWAFLAVAVVQTRALRPKGFPAFLGQDFSLVGYRAFVRYVTPAGKRLRGLYILRSETDRRRMALLGNVFTHYGYATIDLHLADVRAGGLAATSRRGDFAIQVAAPGEAVALPAGSPFGSWAEARRFAGPLPFTFAVEAKARRVVIVEGVREHWQPQPVNVAQAHVGFLEGLPLSKLVLANAFLVRDIPYHWKKGRTDVWHP